MARQKHHGGAHHGGSWKVALADFMTSMFALFLVLWLVASADADRRTLIAGWFRDPSAFKEGSILPVDLGGSQRPRDEPATPLIPPPKRPRVLPSRSVGSSEGLKEIEQSIKATPGLQALGERVAVHPTDEGLEVAMNDAVGQSFFGSGTAALTAEGEEVVAQVAQSLADGADFVVIAGHTDSTPFVGGTKDNWELSADRANAVREALVAAGVRADRIAGVIGYADSRPAKPEVPAAPENRRVTILVTPRPVEPPTPSKLDKLLQPSQQ